MSKIAILIPCFNEESTIAKVIEGFREVLPLADIYVYDNNSSDTTYEIAKKHGAIVRKEFQQGKGCVVRKMLRDIEADFYIMVDGDQTYPSTHVHKLLEPLIREEADMVIGARLSSHAEQAFRMFHKMGNALITRTVNRVFQAQVTDVLSGYRAFTRRFAKKVPLTSKGFEIETEMTINALDRGMRLLEVTIPYGERPVNSMSKLNTFRDGFLILFTILTILKDFRPLFFFGWLAFFSMTFGLGLGFPVVFEYIQTGLVPRFPTAILAASLELLAFQLAGVGLVLDTVGRTRRLTFDLLDKL